MRFHGTREEYEIWKVINRREYLLSPLLVSRRYSGKKLAQWSASDALVLKWSALHADIRLPIHIRCEHRRDHGRALKSVARLHNE